MANNGSTVMYKESWKERLAAPFKKFFGFIGKAISNFFYDLGVKIHYLLHKDGVKKAQTARGKRVGETIFVWSLLLYPLVQFCICYLGVNFNSILQSFKVYLDPSLEVRHKWIDFVSAASYENGGGKLVFLTKDVFFNFKRVVEDFTNPPVGQVSLLPLMGNSMVVWLISTFVGFPLNLVFAYIVYKKVPCAGFFQVVLFLPQILSSIVISQVAFRFMDNGILPWLKETVKDPTKLPDMIFANGESGFGMQIFYSIWAGFGTQLILYYGAMARIPDSLIEFGELEGITMLKEFLAVVLPMIYSTITVFLVTGIAGIFTNQLALFNFFGGGASEKMRTVGYQFYIIVVQNAKMTEYPYASAAGLMFTAIVAPLTLIARHFLEKYGPNVEF